jgi:hypothetical protein
MKTNRINVDMTPLEMIAEWRRGCTNAGPRECPAPVEPTSPAACVECTDGLIEALQKRLTEERDLIRNLVDHIVGVTGANEGSDSAELVERACAETGLVIATNAEVYVQEVLTDEDRLVFAQHRGKESDPFYAGPLIKAARSLVERYLLTEYRDNVDNPMFRLTAKGVHVRDALTENTA